METKVKVLKIWISVAAETIFVEDKEDLELLKTEQQMRERMKQLQHKHGVSEKQVCAHYRIIKT